MQVYKVEYEICKISSHVTRQMRGQEGSWCAGECVGLAFEAVLCLLTKLCGNEFVMMVLISKDLDWYLGRNVELKWN